MSATPTEGLLLVDKPAGPTSHDVVAGVRRALGARRAGHAGTLDPFATGLLLILVGRATRLAEYLAGLDKTYVATLRLGASSTTGDRDGEISEPSPLATPPSEADVRRALAGFLGERDQVPPEFSAVHVGGERAYRMARGGVAFTLEPRRVRLERLEVLEYAYPRLHLRVVTGPGFYVRSLARDLGEALGSAAYLTALRRETIGPFDVERAVAVATGAELSAHLLAAEAAVSHLPWLGLDAAAAGDLARGRRVPASGLPVAGESRGLVALAGPAGFLGVGELDELGLRPVKILHPERALP
ncbi:MAG TPA: tRNA pseudouridine(55) synthase TruB [Gemmatimonadota bacterium]|jgi:tRNA pseudouridine55 synthase